MQETAVVESGSTMTRRRLKEAGFGDEQVQALVDVTGAERRARSADMAGLKASGERVEGEIVLLRTEARGDIATVHTRIDGLRDEVNARFDGFRDEMNARFEKVDVRFDGLRDEMNARFEKVDVRFDGFKDEMNARFDEVDAKFAGVDRQLKVVMWFLGVGLTLYAGTTVSLMMLLFRDTPV